MENNRKTKKQLVKELKELKLKNSAQDLTIRRLRDFKESTHELLRALGHPGEYSINGIRLLTSDIRQNSPILAQPMKIEFVLIDYKEKQKKIEQMYQDAQLLRNDIDFKDDIITQLNNRLNNETQNHKNLKEGVCWMLRKLYDE